MKKSQFNIKPTSHKAERKANEKLKANGFFQYSMHK